MMVLIAREWQGYSSASQAVSELSAIGAPTRPLWAIPGALYTILVIAFGWGTWKSADGNQPLRRVGGLIVAYGALGLLWPFASMHLRETLAAGGGTASDTMHIALSAVTVVLMLLLAAINENVALFSQFVFQPFGRLSYSVPNCRGTNVLAGAVSPKSFLVNTYFSVFQFFFSSYTL